MPLALDWLTTAKECFADDYGSLRQGLLTSIFSLMVGMEIPTNGHVIDVPPGP